MKLDESSNVFRELNWYHVWEMYLSNTPSIILYTQLQLFSSSSWPVNLCSGEWYFPGSKIKQSVYTVNANMEMSFANLESQNAVS